MMLTFSVAIKKEFPPRYYLKMNISKPEEEMKKKHNILGTNFKAAEENPCRLFTSKILSQHHFVTCQHRL